MYSIDQRIWKRPQRQDSRAVGVRCAHLGELPEQMQRMFEFIDKRIDCGERSFVDIPLDSIPAVGFCLVAKRYPHQPPQS